MQAHLGVAAADGADLRFGEPVLEWQPLGDGVRVRTTRATYEADRLVMAAGAWVRSLVPALAELAQPERQVLGWFTPTRPADFAPDRFPVFLIDVEGGKHYYGFPSHEGHGLKIGWYHHFREPIDPADADRSTRPDDEAALREFVERYLPDGAGPTEMLTTCIFTNTPDEHFIVDALPDAPQVLVLSPCSGHGYKFCSVIGEIAADLVVDGATRHDIGLFRLDRFASVTA